MFISFLYRWIRGNSGGGLTHTTRPLARRNHPPVCLSRHDKTHENWGGKWYTRVRCWSRVVLRLSQTSARNMAVSKMSASCLLWVPSAHWCMCTYSFIQYTLWCSKIWNHSGGESGVADSFQILSVLNLGGAASLKRWHIPLQRRGSAGLPLMCGSCCRGAHYHCPGLENQGGLEWTSRNYFLCDLDVKELWLDLKVSLAFQPFSKADSKISLISCFGGFAAKDHDRELEDMMSS